MKKLAFAFLFLLTLSLAASNMQKNKPSSRDSIQLIGLIYNNNDRVKDVSITIYKNNTIFKVVNVKSSNRFRTLLPKDEMLTVEIKAPEFHAKRFIFNTNLPKNLKLIPKYQFDIDLFKEEEISGVNTSVLDFPVGLVAYDEKKKEFLRDKKYTKKMKKAYLQLWEEAQMVERSGIEESEK